MNLLLALREENIKRFAKKEQTTIKKKWKNLEKHRPIISFQALCVTRHEEDLGISRKNVSSWQKLRKVTKKHTVSADQQSTKKLDHNLTFPL